MEEEVSLWNGCWSGETTNVVPEDDAIFFLVQGVYFAAKGKACRRVRRKREMCASSKKMKVMKDMTRKIKAKRRLDGKATVGGSEIYWPLTARKRFPIQDGKTPRRDCMIGCANSGGLLAQVF